MVSPWSMILIKKNIPCLETAMAKTTFSWVVFVATSAVETGLRSGASVTTFARVLRRTLFRLRNYLSAVLQLWAESPSHPLIKFGGRGSHV